jgi:DNA mismatch endonuclease (patch repair protein)
MKIKRAKTTEPVSPERSAQMGLVRNANTKPELHVRRALHRAGLRYRLHDKRLPGKPDIVLSSRRLAIFVHGCFWHRHPNPKCKLARLPKSRLDFWQPKLEGNLERDQKNRAALKALGWRVIVIWECELADDKRLGSLVQDVKALPAGLRSGLVQEFNS